MSRKDRLIASIVARPSEAKFSDVHAVLELHGWALARTKGSHHIYKSEDGTQMITVPTVSGRRVKRRYLDEICRLLELDVEEKGEV